MKKPVRLYYLFNFFFTMLFWLPVFYEYQKRVGLSDAQIFAIQGFYQILFVFLEIPTGLFADVLGRRASLLVGAFLLLLSNLLPVFAPGAEARVAFWLMSASFTAVALARSFVSGAGSAWIYEVLEAQGEERRYAEVEGNARSIALSGKVVFWLGVGAMMEWKLTLPYWLTALSALFACGVAWKMREERRANSSVGVGKARRFTSELGGAMKVLRGAPSLWLVIAQGIFLFTVGRVVEVHLYQPLLLEKSIPLSWHGAVLSFMTVFEALGSAETGQRFLKRLSNLSAVFITTLLLAASLLPMALPGIAPTLLGLVIASVAMGLAYPAQRDLMNEVIPDSRYRATLLSFESMVDRTVTSGVVALLGVYLENAKTATSSGIPPVSRVLLYGSAVTVLGVGALSLLLRFVPSLHPQGVAKNPKAETQ